MVVMTDNYLTGHKILRMAHANINFTSFFLKHPKKSGQHKLKKTLRAPPPPSPRRETLKIQ